MAKRKSSSDSKSADVKESKVAKLSIIFSIFYGCSGNGDSDSPDQDIIIDSNNDQITQSIPPNDVSEMKSLFESFEGISTSSDSEYFYVSSNGLPL